MWHVSRSRAPLGIINLLDPFSEQPVWGLGFRVYRNVDWFQGGIIIKAHILFVSLSLRLKNPVGPVTRVRKTEKKRFGVEFEGCGFGNFDLGLSVQGSEFRVQGSGFSV